MANLPVVIYRYAMSPCEDRQPLAWTSALLIAAFILLLSITVRLVARPFGVYGAGGGWTSGDAIGREPEPYPQGPTHA
jgi:hypothetical protein